jgi:chromosome segregation ATPase
MSLAGDHEGAAVGGAGDRLDLETEGEAVPAGSVVVDLASLDSGMLRRRVDQLTSRLAELEEAVRDRVAELESVHEERRHLELDLAVKDGFIAELLARLAEAEARDAERDALVAELARREAVASDQLRMTRHRVADAVHGRISAVPIVHRPLRTLARKLGDRERPRHTRG